MRKWRVFLFIGLWLVLIGAAMRIDVPVAQWVDAHQPIKPIERWWWLLRLIGRGQTTAVIVLALGLFRRDRWWSAALVGLSGIASAINWAFKWVFGRHRPSAHDWRPFEFHPFHGGLYSLLHAEKNLSMPSGDASLAFSTVAALWIVLPRWRALWVALGLIVMAQRILCNAHYVSDTVAGAGLGVFCTLFVRSLMPRQPALLQSRDFSATTTSPVRHIE